MLTDRMTMAHGLEARSPFLDHELVEFLAKVPWNIKVQNNQPKYLMRKLAAD
jgi:asparagine synthase (glutamine-hydrolysing)